MKNRKKSSHSSLSKIGADPRDVFFASYMFVALVVSVLLGVGILLPLIMTHIMPLFILPIAGLLVVMIGAMVGWVFSDRAVGSYLDRQDLCEHMRVVSGKCSVTKGDDLKHQGKKAPLMDGTNGPQDFDTVLPMHQL